MARLSDSFVGVVIKRLTEVETNRGVSNQHEFNGTVEMRMHLGDDRRKLHAHFIHLGRDADESIALDQEVTWYDAREHHATRTEYRLYFHDNEVMEHARAGDVLIAALRHDNSVVLLIVDGESENLPMVLWLFGGEGATVVRRRSIDPRTVGDYPLSVSSEVAELIGLETAEPPSDAWLDTVVSRFGDKFPSTRELSAFALETLGGNLPVDSDPDTALLTLMDREELLFRELERHIVSQQISASASGWAGNVDEFIRFSLAVHNRRKSRAGYAFENHLEWIFLENHIQFDRGAVTEGYSKPDFLFPGVHEYHDTSFPAASLTMLGAKTTCKDRWRQLLNEAARIPAKHLLTLQPAISDNQTTEMRNADLQLIVPAPLHAGYSSEQQGWLLSLRAFMELVHAREGASA